MKPVIGIVADAHLEPTNERSGGKIVLNWNYVNAIETAGGIAIILPPIQDVSQVIHLIDGLLIPGGNDIDAKHFGEINHEKVELIDEARFNLEQRLLSAISPSMPVLGICYGCQRLNVYRNGTLIQHVPDVVGHEKHTGGTLQSYAVTSGSRLQNIAGTKIAEGQSWHHQAINRLGKDLIATAHEADGTIEAIEDPQHPFCIGVQWHPERTPTSAVSDSLFKAFIAACADYKRVKA